MGRWGIGNFESDTAADHVCELSSNLIQEIDDYLADSCMSDISLINIEILTAIGKKVRRTEDTGIGEIVFPFPMPSIKKVKKWKKKLLKMWDRECADLWHNPKKGKQRREVITKTFDELIQVIELGPQLDHEFFDPGPQLPPIDVSSNEPRVNSNSLLISKFEFIKRNGEPTETSESKNSKGEIHTLIYNFEGGDSASAEFWNDKCISLGYLISDIGQKYADTVYRATGLIWKDLVTKEENKSWATTDGKFEVIFRKGDDDPHYLRMFVPSLLDNIIPDFDDLF